MLDIAGGIVLAVVFLFLICLALFMLCLAGAWLARVARR